MAEYYRKRPVAVQAVQWTGDNAECVQRLAGDLFQPLLASMSVNGTEFTARVYDALRAEWVKVSTGQWIIRGVRGEFYPCDAGVFAEAYERVPGGQEGTGG